MHPSKMLFVGVDIHKKTHAAYAATCFGEERAALQVPNTPEGYLHLAQTVTALAEKESLHPIWGLEDTGGNGAGLARFLTESGHLVKSVNPVLVTYARKKTTHPEKSDPEDAKGVAKVLIQGGFDTLPTHTVTRETENATALRTLVSDRVFLVNEQTRLKNQLHELLCTEYGIGYQELFKDIASQKALKHWIGEVVEEGKSALSALRRRQITRKAVRLLEVKRSVAEIEAEMDLLLAEQRNTLRSMPGCGTVVAATLVAEINDIHRFESSAKFAKYAGLVPIEYSSGQTHRHRKTRSGNRRLNAAIHRIALTQISRQADPTGRTYYEKKLGEGKRKMQALCCLKRQLADILFAMLRDETEYRKP